MKSLIEINVEIHGIYEDLEYNSHKEIVNKLNSSY